MSADSDSQVFTQQLTCYINTKDMFLLETAINPVSNLPGVSAPISGCSRATFPVRDILGYSRRAEVGGDGYMGIDSDRRVMATTINTRCGGTLRGLMAQGFGGRTARLVGARSWVC